MNDSSWFEVDNLSQIYSPALLVYPGRIGENIKRMIKIAGDGQRLMPHVKTHKIPEIVQMQIREGIRKFKCATVAEAEMLGLADAEEVLVACQPVGPNISRIRELCLKFPSTRFSVVTDNRESLASLTEAIEGLSNKPGIYIDLNVGMNRTGIIPGRNAEELFELGISLHADMIGFHAYDGQIHDKEFEEREKKCHHAFSEVWPLKNKLEEKHGIKLILVAGGTPTFPVHAKIPENICSPGTTVLWDYGYQESFPDLDFLPAALLLTRVISRPSENLVCLDLGYKSVASENPLPRVKFLNHPEAVPVSQSEEHLVVRVGKSNCCKTGDVFYALPKHICPTVALYSEAQVIEGKRHIKSWKVLARERKISI